MLTLLLAATLPVSQAATAILEVGPPVEVGVDGRHGRPFVGPDGRWHLGHGRSGHFHDVVLNADLSADLGSMRMLIDGAGRFVDHGLAQCPDGSLLHAASGNLAMPDDSAWVTAISADLVAGPTQLFLDQAPDVSTNDMAVLCADGFRAVAIAGYGDPELEQPQRNWLYRFDDDALAGATPPEVLPAHETPRVNGTSLVWIEEAQQAVFLALSGGANLVATYYDAQGAFASRVTTQLTLDEGRQPYWSAGALRLDAGYAIAHMGRSFDEGFAQDTGNVYLTLSDSELLVTETIALTNLSAPDGAMRPGIAIRGDELLVAWDVDGRFYASVVRIDLDALAELDADLPQDTGAPGRRPTGEDTGRDADTGAPRGPAGGGSTPPASGCATAALASPSGGLLLGLSVAWAALGRRRRP